MPLLLTTPDAVTLRAVPERKGRQKLARWLMFIGGLGIVVAVLATVPDEVCSVQTPCRALPFTSLLVGLVLVAPFLGFVHLWWGAIAAVAMSAALIWHDMAMPSLAAAPWVHVAIVGNAAMCVLLASWAQAQPQILGEWAARQERSAVPTLPHLARPGRVAVATGLVLVCLGMACAAWSVIRQQQADAQQAAAEVVAARVTAVVDEFTIRVELPEGQEVTLDVISADPYPIGSSPQLAVDSRGMHQLLAEPYDATPWLALALALILPGLGLFLRGRAKRLAHQQLFHEPQPATSVFARWHDSAVQLFAGDAANHDLPLFSLAIRHWDQVPQAFPAPVPAGEMAPVAVSPPVRATLYGIPAAGQWCTAVVNGVGFEPEKPIGLSRTMVPLRPGEAGQERPLAAAEVAALSVTDYAPQPERLHVVRVRPVVAYALTLAMPLVAVEFFRRLPGWVAPTLVYAIIGAVSAALMFFGWLTFIRPRVAWNGGGVTIRGLNARRVRTLRWSEVSELTIDGEVVMIATGGDAFGVSAPRFGGISANELWLRLRNARLRADPHTAPPAGFAAGGYEGALVAALTVAVTAGLSTLVLWAYGWTGSA